MSRLPRRDFMRSAAATAAAFTILPGGSLGKARRISPSDRVNLAAIGVGGMGRANLQALSSQNIVALCDVDWNYVDTRFAEIPNQVAAAQKRAAEAADPLQKERALQQVKDWNALTTQLPKARRFDDYRVMLEKHKDIDAVVIA